MAVVSRDLLHDEVWSNPLVEVSKKYGVSDQRLKMICEKHRIPIPSRIYWKKIAEGIKVKKTHYRSITDSELNSIVINSEFLSDRVVSRKNHKELSNSNVLRHPNCKPFEFKETTALHSLAKSAKVELENCSPDWKGLCYTHHETNPAISVGQSSVLRIISFLHHLCLEAERYGHEVVISKNSYMLIVQGEALEFDISEKINHATHIMTEEEAKVQSLWEKRCQSKSWEVSRKAWSNVPDIKTFDYTPSGNLTFKFTKDTFSSLRRTFSDGKVQRLEGMIEKIIEGAVKLSVATKERREQQERWHREYEERMRLEYIEIRRAKELRNMMVAWKSANELKMFVADVRHKFGAACDTEAAKEWLDWVEAKNEKLDPLSSGFPVLYQHDESTKSIWSS